MTQFIIVLHKPAAIPALGTWRQKEPELRILLNSIAIWDPVREGNREELTQWLTFDQNWWQKCFKSWVLGFIILMELCETLSFYKHTGLEDCSRHCTMSNFLCSVLAYLPKSLNTPQPALILSHLSQWTLMLFCFCLFVGLVGWGFVLLLKQGFSLWPRLTWTYSSLPQFSQCWNYRHELCCLLKSDFFLSFKFNFVFLCV